MPAPPQEWLQVKFGGKIVKINGTPGNLDSPKAGDKNGTPQTGRDNWHPWKFLATAAFGGQENLLFLVYFASFLKGNRNPNTQNFLACGAK